MEILIKAAQMILILSIIVVLHEGGHYAAAKFFKTNFKDIDQKSDIVASKNTPIICGHNKEFGNCEHNIYMTDTSESKYPDYRIMVIQINRGELNMSAMSIDFTYPVLPCFPRPPKKK